MKIEIVGIEKPFELKTSSESGSTFGILKKREIQINFTNQSLQSISTILIPKSFKTDLASIPQILWGIFPPIGTKNEHYGNAAILHDYLYNNKSFDRKTCDLIFLQAMKQKKCNLFIRYLFYFAVRIFGGKHY
jgi:hypothetical protein